MHGSENDMVQNMTNAIFKLIICNGYTHNFWWWNQTTDHNRLMYLFSKWNIRPDQTGYEDNSKNMKLLLHKYFHFSKCCSTDVFPNVANKCCSTDVLQQMFVVLSLLQQICCCFDVLQHNNKCCCSDVGVFLAVQSNIQRIQNCKQMKNIIYI